MLSGKVNATGALATTYAYSNESSPAMQNFGGDYYTDYEIVAANAINGYDPRWPDTDIANTIQSSSFGGGAATYNGGQYIVEAEGIYVGYKYYETRYYDSIVNPTYNASSSAGSVDGEAWDYGKEVVYTFGHGLSYLDYEQNIRSVSVDNTPEGNVTARIAVHNMSDKDGKFLAQLYVQQPYTQYDIDNKVEKSAVSFLNSKKVEVKAGETEIVEITIPTKYLASYDYTNAKTYILDEGDYVFTAAAGAHEAVNNILAAQGYEGDSDAAGSARVWSLGSHDATTFRTDNGYVVTNVADNADLNYWLPDTVTYLSRSDWEGTYPKNYNEDVEVTLADSFRKDEWIKELRGQQYTIDNGGAEVENVDGTDLGLRFSSEDIDYERLTDIDNGYWNDLVSQISVNEAIGAVIHGGSRTDVLTTVENPVVIQNEGVNGFTTAYTKEDGSSYKFNISSQTLLASSFNPELAWEWGVIEGNNGLWLQRYDVWGTGLTQIRTPYNGRNYEYISEDPMLSNRMGYGVMGGAKSKGVMVGPKHIGFNDQEHNRNGVSAYMNEQKMRETDLRCFQGGLDDAGGLAVMVAFNRIGATNASHHAGMLQTILRKEWGFKGLISTDMMNNKYYFNAESMIMAGITQVADFASNNSYIDSANNHGGADSNWTYITVDAVKNDATLVNQARQNLKYQLYAFANSAVLNISTVRVTPWWETAVKAIITVSAVLTGVCGLAWLVTTVMPAKKKEEN